MFHSYNLSGLLFCMTHVTISSGNNLGSIIYYLRVGYLVFYGATCLSLIALKEKFIFGIIEGGEGYVTVGSVVSKGSDLVFATELKFIVTLEIL